MIDLRAWQLAFLKQARSDWETYQRIDDPVWPTCHRLHFLQMATEKLAKALLVAGDMPFDKIHPYPRRLCQVYACCSQKS
jgi:hypothetical protein